MEDVSHRQPWHVDPKTYQDVFRRRREEKFPKTSKSYQLVNASPFDCDLVSRLYNQSPIPGYDLGIIEVIYNEAIQKAFETAMDLMELKGVDNQDLDRQAKSSDGWVKKAHPSSYKYVKLLPMFHGTKLELLESIYLLGFDYLGHKQDSVLGKGIFCSSHACEAYNNGDGGLLFTWVAASHLVEGNEGKGFSYPTSVAYSDISSTDMLFAQDPSNVFPRYRVHLTPNALLIKKIQDLSLPAISSPALLSELGCKELLEEEWKNFAERLQKFSPLNCKFYNFQRIIWFAQQMENLDKLEGLNKNILAKRIAQAVNIEKVFRDKVHVNEYTSDQANNLTYGVIEDKKQADLGDRNAHYRLAVCYEHGWGVHQELKKAARHYLHAQNYKKAFYCFQQVAWQGDAEANEYISLAIQEGWGVQDVIRHTPKDYKWKKDFVSRDQLDRKTFLLAPCFELGLSVKQDYAKAAKYYLATNQYFKAAKCYQMNGEFEKAIKFYQSADPKNSAALFQLGLCHEQGVGVEKSVVKASEYYIQAANLGHAEAHYLLAVFSETDPKAIKYYQMAAKKDCSEAYAQLGSCYQRGLGVDIDLLQAGEYYRAAGDLKRMVECYQKAADQYSLPEAQNALGMCYHIGLGVERNLKKAEEYYKKAVDQRSVSAVYHLTMCHQFGKKSDLTPPLTDSPLLANHCFNTWLTTPYLISKNNHLSPCGSISMALATLQPSAINLEEVNNYIKKGERPDFHIDTPFVIITPKGDLTIQLSVQLLNSQTFIANLNSLGLVGSLSFDIKHGKQHMMFFRVPCSQIQSFLMDQLHVSPLIYNELNTVYPQTKIDQQTKFRSQISKKNKQYEVDNLADYIKAIEQSNSSDCQDLLQSSNRLKAIFPPDLKNITFSQQPLGGSTGAELVDIHGIKYVLKKPSEKGREGHLKAEYFCNQVYKSLGVPVPEFIPYNYDNQLRMLSQYIDGVSLKSYLEDSQVSSPEKEQIKALLQRDFVLDCLLANWDVIGIKCDNVIVSKKGIPYRIDNGSGFDYRAQGEKKSQWGEKVIELQTMRSFQLNPNAALIYSGIKDQEIKRQIEEIVAHRHVILSATPEEYKEIVYKRICYLIQIAIG